MAKRKLFCIDLFSGAGGLGTGFKAAGFEIVAALESIPAFAKTHAANFPGCHTVVADIERMSPKLFASKVGIAPGSVDVIVGGPPCQTFSTIGTPKIQHVTGKDVRTDPRNYLFKTFLDYVAYFKPSIFVMENVPQLKTKYNGILFTRILEIVDKLGYSIHMNILNAVNFGVPQSRRRLFVVGVLGQHKFSFPEAQFGLSNDMQKSFNFVQNRSLGTARTVSDALDDLPKIYDGCRLGPLPYHVENPLNKYQRQLRSRTGKVDNNVCRVSNDRAKRVFRHMKPGQRYMDLPERVRRILPFREDIFHDRLKRLVPDAPSWTILAHIGMDGYMYIHPYEDRTLSVREAARIQSFPDSFVFSGNMREQYVQVGNAVPPMLAQAIASNVLRAF